MLLAGFDKIERLSVFNNPVCLSKSSLREYIVRTMPRLVAFNDVIITDEERVFSRTPTPTLYMAAEPVRNSLQTLVLHDLLEGDREKGREKEETEREMEEEWDGEGEGEGEGLTVHGPRAGSAMCYPLRARDLDRDEGDSLSHTNKTMPPPRPSSPPTPRLSDTDTYTYTDIETVVDVDVRSAARLAFSSTGDDDPHPVPEESERVFKAMVLMYFRQVIHETVEASFRT